MRRTPHLIGALALGAAVLARSTGVFQGSSAGADPPEGRPPSHSPHVKATEDEVLGVRAVGGPVPAEGYEKGAEQWRRLPAAPLSGRPTAPGASARAATFSALSASIPGVSAITGTVWIPIGPSPVLQGTSKVNGRVNAIAINPNNPNVIFQ